MPTALRKVISDNKHKFAKGAWKNYTDEELQSWVNLFSKRSLHRSNGTKALEDLKNARNYLVMLESAVNSRFA